ncbi:MAG TPA: sulfate reduction electron transfer complex DsrMKJOP subunit DsrM [Spirochaetota bacterium]|nr:sulfate reduction electron transfer complex DsrMKJOP subunit DsrM [Spirochaetota bacterium]HPV39658.1 sulfate reduction electron transfer complex DsrMKJOP subunit DsrM [Spirochaetota bacterium]
MRIAGAIAAVVIAAAAAWTCAALGMKSLIGIALPYAGLTALVAGMAFRVARWTMTPVPFNIAVTCGQQKSIPGVRPDPLDNPQRPWTAALRVIIEAALFRSLFRNSKARRSRNAIVYGPSTWLWLGSMAFHWTMLIIVLRHLRLAIEPVPAWAELLQRADGIFHIGTPPLLLTDIIILCALLFLIMRRIADRKTAYISLFQDYFFLALIGAVALSGIWLRHFSRVDLLAVKQYVLGLLALKPALPDGAPPSFYVHITLVSILAAAIPAGKISHMAGMFLSPTRNTAADSRRRRHINPWNPDVPVHTYREWEEEFRERLVKAGYDLEGDGNG